MKPLYHCIHEQMFQLKVPINNVILTVLYGWQDHRRNNHGDQGRQVPPPQLLGWGTSNVLVFLNFWSNAASHHCVALKHRLLAQLNESERLYHLAVLHVHRDRLLYSTDIDVIAREFVAKSENRLATFGRI